MDLCALVGTYLHGRMEAADHLRRARRRRRAILKELAGGAEEEPKGKLQSNLVLPASSADKVTSRAKAVGHNFLKDPMFDAVLRRRVEGVVEFLHRIPLIGVILTDRMHQWLWTQPLFYS